MRIRTLSLATVLAAGFLVSPASSGGKPALSPKAAADAVWGKLLTHCGDSYFYGGSLFDHSGMLSGLGAGENPTVIEFRGIKFDQVPMGVTDAERMNGIQYRARITTIAHVYRDDGGAWIDGPATQPRNTNEVLGRALQDIAGDTGELGNGGAIAFDLVQYKGSWAIARSSTDVSGPLSFDTKYYDVQKLVALRMNRYDCKAGKMMPPLPTPAEITAKKAADAEAARQAAADRAKREEDRDDKDNAPIPAPPPAQRHDQASANPPAASRDPVKGIAFGAVSDADFSALMDIYKDHMVGDPADYAITQRLASSYDLGGDNWLAPGTTYEKVRSNFTFGSAIFFRHDAFPDIDRRVFVIIRVTSGAHAGHYVFIETTNYDEDNPIVCPPNDPQHDCIKP